MDLFLFLKKQLMFNTDFLQKEKEDDRRGYSSKQADKLFFGLQIYIYTSHQEILLILTSSTEL